MRIKIIENGNTAEFKIAFEIYQQSFPVYEQRTLATQLEALQNPYYKFQVIENDEHETLGLLLTWQTDRFVYIEHFAVTPAARGHNIGTKILTSLIENTDVPIILEIDPPVDEISIRRKNFYERLGFVVTEHEYIHPSYQPHTSPHHLRILSLPLITNELYKEFQDFLQTQVLRYMEI